MMIVAIIYRVYILPVYYCLLLLWAVVIKIILLCECDFMK